jgi:arsenate reductase (glutaredoxin)
MKIWHNPNCSKSRATVEYLNENNISYETREYLKDSPSKDEIKEVVKQLNLSNIKDMMRQKEEEFLELGLEKENITNEDLIDAMVKIPKLIERPIAINNNKAVICRPLENINNIIK